MMDMIRRKIACGPIGENVYDRTYSRRKSDGTKETWEETVRRVVDGNLSLVDSKYHLKGEREELFNLITNFKAIPAGRHLWVTGVPGRQFLFNPFRGDTKVRTKNGYIPIKELVGKTVEVLGISDSSSMKDRKYHSN